jgi:glutaredoxin
LKKISFIFLPFLFFLYVAGETYLKLNHSTLCESTGCKLADSLLLFDSIYLNYIGVVAGVGILVTGILSYKKVIHENLFYIVVGSALLFETIMLGYQYFASPEMCKFCMGVYTFLVVIMLTASFKHFIVAMMGVVSVLMALSFLAIPQSKPYVMKDGTYLLQSVSCPHCTKVKKYMKENYISFTKIDIEDIEAQHFATFLNFKTIPILITKEGNNIKIINGDKDIINSYKKSNSGEVVIEESVSINSTFDVVKDEGCGFANLNKLAEESDCTSPSKK